MFAQSARKLALIRPDFGAATVSRMKDEEREAAVAAHLKALDDEIARLRQMEAAMDRRLEEAEQERRAIAEQMRPEEPRGD